MPEASEHFIEATFCFVDVAGFTALTEAHGDRAAADLIQRFDVLVHASLAPPGSIIDFIGDAVFVTYPTPSGALLFLTTLFSRAEDESDFPDLRAGLHHGAALERGGRYFGAAINLASRVAGHARGGQILSTGSVALGAREFASTPIGSVTFRNVIDPVELYSIEVDRRNEATRIDPVCRMRIAPDRIAGHLRHGQTDFWFCSLECAAQFAAAPATYAAAASDVKAAGDTKQSDRKG